MTSQRQLGYGSSQRERERSRSRKGGTVEVGEGFFPRTNLFLSNLDESVFCIEKKVAKTHLERKSHQESQAENSGVTVRVTGCFSWGLVWVPVNWIEPAFSANSKAKNDGPSMSSQWVPAQIATMAPKRNEGLVVKTVVGGWQSKFCEIWANYTDHDQTTWLVTPNSRWVTACPQNAFNSGLGIIYSSLPRCMVKEILYTGIPWNHYRC